MRDKLKISEGDTLKFESSRSKGFMGETDVTDYTILDSSGNVVGTVEYTEHTAVRGLRTTNSVVQKDVQGKVVIQASWHPKRHGA